MCLCCFFLQLQRITHSNCIKANMIAKSGSHKRCCSGFLNRHLVVYLCLKKPAIYLVVDEKFFSVL